jgi:Flp pilus assembly protein TadG
MMSRMICQIFAGLLSCRAGNFALAFALLAPLLLGLTGGVVDFFAYERNKSAMQGAADAIALAATNEASVHDWSPTTIQAVAENFVQANLAPTDDTDTSQYKVVTTPDRDKRELSVSITADHHNYFFLGYFTGSPQIVVSAVAKLSGETPVCLLTLEDYNAGATTIAGSSLISAKGCAAYSNSGSPIGLDVSTASKVVTAAICTGGGYRGKLSSFVPAPTLDCPVMADPLAGRIAPTVGPCDFKNFTIKKATQTLNPGVYCGGILIETKSDVTLNPCIYIISGGEFKTTGLGSVTGNGVTIYFTGSDGRLLLDGTSSVSLEAPSTGPTAGLLLFQDPAMALTKYEISSMRASKLLGTIYLPNGHLIINANNKIAEASAFTVIVSRYFEVGATTQLYLNSNYSATTVPVPNGLGPNTKNVRLIN